MKTFYLLLIPLFALIAFSRSVDDLKEPKTVQVMLNNGSRWIKIDDLQTEAMKWVIEKEPDHSFTSDSISVWINPFETNAFVHFLFSKGIGKTGYLIYFDRDGKVSRSVSGIGKG